MNRINILLAEDHLLVRAGIRALLEQLDGVRVVAETGNGQDVARLVQKVDPDVMLLDISMPGLNGLEVAARIGKEFPKVRIIILSMHANEEYVLQALRVGVAGYLLKDAQTAELELAIRAVVRGETYLTPSVSRQVMADYLGRLNGKLPAAVSEAGPYERLTTRQREIVQMIAEGLTTKGIAQKLNLSVKTVEAHRSQLMERLDIHDIAGLVRYALRTGLVSSGQSALS